MFVVCVCVCVCVSVWVSVWVCGWHTSPNVLPISYFPTRFTIIRAQNQGDCLYLQIAAADNNNADDNDDDDDLHTWVLIMKII